MSKVIGIDLGNRSIMATQEFVITCVVSIMDGSKLSKSLRKPQISEGARTTFPKLNCSLVLFRERGILNTSKT